MMRSIFRITFCVLALQIPGIAAAKIGVKLGANWDGKSVPAGQQCKLDGGNGSPPPDGGQRPAGGHGDGGAVLQ